MTIPTLPARPQPATRALPPPQLLRVASSQARSTSNQTTTTTKTGCPANQGSSETAATAGDAPTTTKSKTTTPPRETWPCPRLRGRVPGGPRDWPRPEGGTQRSCAVGSPGPSEQLRELGENRLPRPGGVRAKEILHWRIRTHSMEVCFYLKRYLKGEDQLWHK